MLSLVLMVLAAHLGGCGTVAKETETPAHNATETIAYLNASRVRNAFSNAPFRPRYLNDVNVSRCLRQRGELVSFVSSFRLDSGRWAVDSASPNVSWSCSLLVAASRGKRFRIYVRRVKSRTNCTTGNFVTVRDYDYGFQTTDCQAGGRYSSRGSVLEIVISLKEPGAMNELSLNAVARDASFQVAFFFNNEGGTIKTRRFEDEEPYRHAVDTWIVIPVSLGHVTLISVKYLRHTWRHSFDYEPGCVRLYRNAIGSGTLVWRMCGDLAARPGVYDARLMYLRYTGKHTYLWVHLVYSFHQRSSQPARVKGSRWNCSLGYWEVFERHLGCNLETECEDGEDERSCEYSGHCGRGRITLWPADTGWWCYSYVLGRHVSWRDSNIACQRRGGHLVSLNGPSEWERVGRVLQLRPSDTKILIGQMPVPSVLPAMYTGMHMWADRTIVYFSKYAFVTHNKCAVMEYPYSGVRMDMDCNKKERLAHYVCEFSRYFRGQLVDLPFPINETLPVPVCRCPDGHATHAFLACDRASACWARGRRAGADAGADADPEEEEEARGIPAAASCPVPMVTSLPAMFACGSGEQRVPYSLVCDYRRHCADDSDESFCVFAPCSGSNRLRCHASARCVPLSAVCDRQRDCSMGNDEGHCFSKYRSPAYPPPAVVDFKLVDAYSDAPIVITRLDSVLASCPLTHFKCKTIDYCLPLYLRCNGVKDCPGSEDENGCDSERGLLCLGLFRCRQSPVCLHPRHVCDAMYQCPQHDDELLCRLTCPAGCTCYGLDFRCHRKPFPTDLLENSQVRYLDASGSDLALVRLSRENNMLIHLSLSRCGLRSVGRGNLTFPNLRSLDLSRNFLLAIRADHLRGMKNLQRLSLFGNPLNSFFAEDATTTPISYPALRTLDVSGVRIPELNTRVFDRFPGLETLNLSQCGVESVTGEGLRASRELRVVDLAGCPMLRFPRGLLSGLGELRAVRADNFKMCCPDTLPAGFNPARCQAPFNEVSSCQSLLRSDVYVLFLALFAALASLGNLGCFAMRSFYLKSSSSGFGVFVSHLTVSDFMMGVYLSVIGVADRLYKGSYLWEDVGWRHSAACRAAGFLSLLSNETSAFIICLITLDRFLVLHFPFSRARFRARSAHAACAAVWVATSAMAALPLTPLTSRWSFYSQTGICLPLPVTRGDFAGRRYSFGVLIVLNLALFLLIAAGQAAIYASIRANRLSAAAAADSTRKSNDLRIARRLITVAVSDFLCWFPVGLLGLLAARGVPVPGEANVGMAILVLPLNSAINPFIYTLNVLLERRRKARDERMMKQLLARMGEEEK